MTSTRPVAARLRARAVLAACLAVVAGGARAADVCAMPQVQTLLDRCPANDPAFGRILADFTITRNGAPVAFPPAACTEPASAVPIAQYTDELSLVQALRAVYYMDRDRCGHLPWTPLSLYEWLRSKVGGFDISSTATFDSCCGLRPDGSAYITLRAANDATREYHRTWEGAAEWIALLMHEARHRDGFPHVSCCPSGPGACDQSYDETNLSPYGIQYWLERAWLDGTIHTGYTCLASTRATAIKSWLRMAANDRPTRFCTSPPPVLTDANNPPPACDQRCATSVSCVAPAWGVPPAGGPPVWWTTAPADPVYHDSLDDPRWSGASKITYADGTGEKAELRALHEGGSLYLSWRALVAPASTPGQNVLYLGYRRAAGGDVIVKLALAGAGPLRASTAVTATAFLRDANGTAGPTVPLPPDVAATARVWADPLLPGSWAIQLRLPLSALQATCGRVQLWYQLLAGTPTAPVASFTWPRAGAEVDEGTAASPHPAIYPDPETWHWLRPSTGPSDARCATAGVSLDHAGIGTTSASSSEIRYRATAPFPVNTLFARPTNHSGAAIPAGGITATFRLANWGSVPGNWEQGVPAAELWAPIPGGADVPTTGAIPDGATAGAASDARFDWTVSGADLAAFVSGARRPHQCLLVELKSTASPGVTFTNASVYRNMDLVSASTFRRDASLSVKGLAATAAGARDVYVYVEAQGMPERVKPDAGREARAAASGERPPVAATSERTAAAPLPRYRVHVYHDSGKILTLDGVKRPVLRYQTSFGYDVSHRGELEGWRHALDGGGLERLAERWYRIRVPDGGEVKLTTTIEAVEPPAIRWSLSLHTGAALPVGTSRSLHDPGAGGGLDVEALFRSRYAVEAFLGPDALPGQSGAADLRVTHLSLSGKVYLTPGRTRPFVLAGAGAYDLRPGSLRAGIHAGAGVQVEVTPRLAVEATGKLHDVPGAGPALRFATAQGGLRLRL